MGKSQKRKGNEGERELVKLLNKAGVECRKTPMSGALHFWKGDVEFAPYFENGEKGEVKRREDIANKYYKILDNVFEPVEVVNKRNKESFVLMRIEDFIEIKRGELIYSELIQYPKEILIKKMLIPKGNGIKYVFGRKNNQYWLCLMRLADFGELFKNGKI